MASAFGRLSRRRGAQAPGEHREARKIPIDALFSQVMCGIVRSDGRR